jgi:molecular chaperone Hsp33
MSLPNGSPDLLHRFLLQRSGVRGVLLQLNETWQAVIARGDYPPALQRLLGEATAAAALLTGHVKVDGRLAIQLRGEHNLKTLFADCDSQGRVRAIALWNPPLPDPLGPRDLGDSAVLAITIENRPPGRIEPTRYQGLVSLQAETLAQALEHYFDNSEQLPTRLLLAADGARAGGLMLQQLPGNTAGSDDWPRAQALFDTLGGAELLATDAPTLLYRLFHEEEVRLLSTQPLRFGCSCSRKRVGEVLLALGRDEAWAALDSGGGAARITCEFCNEQYRFDQVDLEQLFAGGGSEPPTQLQ